MYNCERFELRSHFKSRLSLIVRVNVVLNRTVVVNSDWRFDNLCGSHLQTTIKIVVVVVCSSNLLLFCRSRCRRCRRRCLSSLLFRGWGGQVQLWGGSLTITLRTFPSSLMINTILLYTVVQSFTFTEQILHKLKCNFCKNARHLGGGWPKFTLKFSCSHTLALGAGRAGANLGRVTDALIC